MRGRGLVRAAGAGAGAGVVAASLTVSAGALARRRRRRRRQAADPCGPLGLSLPGGRPASVTTDDGADLAVTVLGSTSGPAVVLCHCWTGDQSMWAPVARRLARLDIRVVLYDQRGHGASTYGAGVPDIYRLGADLATVLEAMDVTDAVLSGHSLGGMTIEAFAATYGVMLAERVRGVVLVGTAARVIGRRVPTWAVERALGEGHLEWTRRGRVGAILARRAVGRAPVPAHVEYIQQHLRDVSAAARVDCAVAMTAMDLRAGIESIGVPVTVLVGSRDRLTPPRLARDMVRHLPGADLVVLPGAGHTLPLEAPDRIVDAIVRLHRSSAPAAASFPPVQKVAIR